MLNKTILILGGTRQALDLAIKLDQEPGCRVITSLAGRTNNPTIPAGELRVGGFGGVEALANYLIAESIDILVDATHPFAAVISRNAAQAATKANIPRIMLQRPPWQVEDEWKIVSDLHEAAERLETDARCFLTIGWQLPVWPYPKPHHCSWSPAY